MNTLPLRRTAICLALAAFAAPALADPASERALIERVDRLARELEAVKAELAAMKASDAVSAAPVAATSSVAASEPATVLTSYGEINLTVPTEQPEATQFDIQRFVLGFQHRFNAKTKLISELEVEHAVTSADDAGEVAIEQAYVEREISDRFSLRGGLMLMPLGFLNETHEPTTYYGVQRNFVETAIIPSTLREGGVQGVFTLGEGYTLQTGVVTGPDLSSWDATSTDGIESPLAAVHQEGQLAKARDPSFFGALNWRGIPGLQLGASAIGGNATHGTPGFPTASYLLWDVHARYSPGAWKLSALYAQGSFSNTAALNAPLVGNPTLFPKRFDGALVEAGYKLWQQDDLSLEPFARWEQFNTGRRYADLGAGLTPARRPTERVTTLGASLFLSEGVVLKADYQFFQQANDADRLNLGLGWSF